MTSSTDNKGIVATSDLAEQSLFPFFFVDQRFSFDAISGHLVMTIAWIGTLKDILRVWKDQPRILDLVKNRHYNSPEMQNEQFVIFNVRGQQSDWMEIWPMSYFKEKVTRGHVNEIIEKEADLAEQMLSSSFYIGDRFTPKGVPNQFYTILAMGKPNELASWAEVPVIRYQIDKQGYDQLKFKDQQFFIFTVELSGEDNWFVVRPLSWLQQRIQRGFLIQVDPQPTLTTDADLAENVLSQALVAYTVNEFADLMQPNQVWKAMPRREGDDKIYLNLGSKLDVSERRGNFIVLDNAYWGYDEISINSEGFKASLMDDRDFPIILVNANTEFDKKADLAEDAFNQVVVNNADEFIQYAKPGQVWKGNPRATADPFLYFHIGPNMVLHTERMLSEGDIQVVDGIWTAWAGPVATEGYGQWILKADYPLILVSTQPEVTADLAEQMLQQTFQVLDTVFVRDKTVGNLPLKNEVIGLTGQVTEVTIAKDFNYGAGIKNAEPGEMIYTVDTTGGLAYFRGSDLELAPRAVSSSQKVWLEAYHEKQARNDSDSMRILTAFEGGDALQVFSDLAENMLSQVIEVGDTVLVIANTELLSSIYININTAHWHPGYHKVTGVYPDEKYPVGRDTKYYCSRGTVCIEGGAFPLEYWQEFLQVVEPDVKTADLTEKMFARPKKGDIVRLKQDRDAWMELPSSVIKVINQSGGWDKSWRVTNTDAKWIWLGSVEAGAIIWIPRFSWDRLIEHPLTIESDLAEQITRQTEFVVTSPNDQDHFLHIDFGTMTYWNDTPVSAAIESDPWYMVRHDNAWYFKSNAKEQSWRQMSENVAEIFESAYQQYTGMESKTAAGPHAVKYHAEFKDGAYQVIFLAYYPNGDKWYYQVPFDSKEAYDLFEERHVRTPGEKVNVIKDSATLSKKADLAEKVFAEPERIKIRALEHRMWRSTVDVFPGDIGYVINHRANDPNYYSVEWEGKPTLQEVCPQYVGDPVIAGWGAQRSTFEFVNPEEEKLVKEADLAYDTFLSTQQLQKGDTVELIADKLALEYCHLGTTTYADPNNIGKKDVIAWIEPDDLYIYGVKGSKYENSKGSFRLLNGGGTFPLEYWQDFFRMVNRKQADLAEQMLGGQYPVFPTLKRVRMREDVSEMARTWSGKDWQVVVEPGDAGDVIYEDDHSYYVVWDNHPNIFEIMERYNPKEYAERVNAGVPYSWSVQKKNAEEVPMTGTADLAWDSLQQVTAENLDEFADNVRPNQIWQGVSTMNPYLYTGPKMEIEGKRSYVIYLSDSAWQPSSGVNIDAVPFQSGVCVNDKPGYFAEFPMLLINANTRPSKRRVRSDLAEQMLAMPQVIPVQFGGCNWTVDFSRKPWTFWETRRKKPEPGLPDGNRSVPAYVRRLAADNWEWKAAHTNGWSALTPSHLIPLEEAYNKAGMPKTADLAYDMISQEEQQPFEGCFVIVTADENGKSSIGLTYLTFSQPLQVSGVDAQSPYKYGADTKYQNSLGVIIAGGFQFPLAYWKEFLQIVPFSERKSDLAEQTLLRPIFHKDDKVKVLTSSLGMFDFKPHLGMIGTVYSTATMGQMMDEFSGGNKRGRDFTDVFLRDKGIEFDPSLRVLFLLFGDDKNTAYPYLDTDVLLVQQSVTADLAEMTMGGTIAHNAQELKDEIKPWQEWAIPKPELYGDEHLFIFDNPWVNAKSDRGGYGAIISGAYELPSEMFGQMWHKSDYRAASTQATAGLPPWFFPMTLVDTDWRSRVTEWPIVGLGDLAEQMLNQPDEIVMRAPDDSIVHFDFYTMTYWVEGSKDELTIDNPGYMNRQLDGTWIWRSSNTDPINWHRMPYDFNMFWEEAHQKYLGNTKTADLAEEMLSGKLEDQSRHYAQYYGSLHYDTAEELIERIKGNTEHNNAQWEHMFGRTEVDDVLALLDIYQDSEGQYRVKAKYRNVPQWVADMGELGVNEIRNMAESNRQFMYGEYSPVEMLPIDQLEFGEWNTQDEDIHRKVDKAFETPVILTPVPVIFDLTGTGGRYPVAAYDEPTLEVPYLFLLSEAKRQGITQVPVVFLNWESPEAEVQAVAPTP